MPGKRKLILFYLVAAVVLLIGLGGITRLFYKAGLPFDYNSKISSKGVYVESEFNSLHKGDEIISLNGEPVENEFKLEFLLDRLTIGDSADIVIRTASGSEKKDELNLVPYYKDSLFIIISLRSTRMNLYCLIQSK